MEQRMFIMENEGKQKHKTRMRYLKRVPLLMGSILAIASFTFYSTNVKAELTEAKEKFI